MIDKLEMLLALASERHFGRAAEVVGVTQQSFSAGIKQLEDRLGVLLVQRGSRFQGFTAEGEKALEWARRIVGDSRAMRQEVRRLSRGLAGHLRIAAIPTALPVIASLTTPFHARHPGVRFTIRSTTSAEILSLLANLEADIGLTYLDNEPLGRVTALPLYRESYRLITPADAPLGRRDAVTWAEAAEVPLCLLTPDMQNRRIIDAHLRAAGTAPATALESNSMIVLMTHVRTGRWASILPTVLAESLGLTGHLRAIPITAPEVSHAIGLVALQRDPALPLVSAFIAEAREAALGFSGGEEVPV